METLKKTSHKRLIYVYDSRIYTKENNSILFMHTYTIECKHREILCKCLIFTLKFLNIPQYRVNINVTPAAFQTSLGLNLFILHRLRNKFSEFILSRSRCSLPIGEPVLVPIV